MLSYHDTEFTEELMSEIALTVSSAGAVEILGYVKGDRSLLAGFQLRKSSCGAFRKRIIQKIRTMDTLDEKTADLLYNSGLGLQFVTVLSARVLKCQLAEFASIFGAAPFTLALLLDPRSRIRKLGSQMLADPCDVTQSKDDACRTVADAMRPFTLHYRAICSLVTDPDSENNAVTLHKQTGEVERQLKAEQKRNGELSNRLQDEKKTSLLQLTEKNDRIEKLLVELDVLRTSLDAQKKEAGRLHLLLEEERHGVKTAIESGIQLRLDGLTNNWLRNAVDLEQECRQSAPTTDLLAQVEAVIARQIHADRHTGNLRFLRERLTTIGEKLSEVRDILAQAFHPLGELVEIETRLAAEERRLSYLLENATNESSPFPLAQALAARINVASTHDGLHRCEQLLEELQSMGLLKTEYSFLQSKLAERYDRFITEYGDVAVPLNPALRFRSVLSQGSPVALVCDGHNIINSMIQFEHVRNRDHGKARQSLIDAITSLCQSHPHCTATIVYDGPDDNQISVGAAVTVMYSGGGKTEKHRADKRIAELINWRSYTDNSTPVYLVTDDNDLAQEARGSGAEVMPLEFFSWFLN